MEGGEGVPGPGGAAPHRPTVVLLLLLVVPTAHAVFSNAKGVHIIPAVDTATGKEVSRITMANATFFVGALAFCPPDFV